MNKPILVTYATGAGSIGGVAEVGIWQGGDHRDWKAIHEWAAALKPLLGAVQDHAV